MSLLSSHSSMLLRAVVTSSRTGQHFFSRLGQQSCKGRSSSSLCTPGSSTPISRSFHCAVSAGLKSLTTTPPIKCRPLHTSKSNPVKKSPHHHQKVTANTKTMSKPKVFFDISADGAPLGRIIIEVSFRCDAPVPAPNLGGTLLTLSSGIPSLHLNNCSSSLWQSSSCKIALSGIC